MRVHAALLISAVLLAGCSPKEKPEALMAKAGEAERAADFQKALDLYAGLVRDHPDDPLAERAQFQIASIRQNTTRDLQGAVEAYREYIRRWPEGKSAPTALFLIGYVYHNELRNLDSAAAAYGAFLAKYPGHEMAESARYELANLGKSPEELLPPGAGMPADPQASAPHPPAPKKKGGGK